MKKNEIIHNIPPQPENSKDLPTDRVSLNLIATREKEQGLKNTEAQRLLHNLFIDKMKEAKQKITNLRQRIQFGQELSMPRLRTAQDELQTELSYLFLSTNWTGLDGKDQEKLVRLREIIKDLNVEEEMKYRKRRVANKRIS